MHFSCVGMGGGVMVVTQIRVQGKVFRGGVLKVSLGGEVEGTIVTNHGDRV